MQNIKFIFRVQVAPGLVKWSFAKVIEDAIAQVSGVENVHSSRFTFNVYIQRPHAERAKQISDELKEAFEAIEGVVSVKEAKGWSRY